MDESRGRLWRTRWAAIGAAVAVSVGAGGVMAAHAGGDGASSFVPITPCRLVDTRASSTVGTRSTPLGAGETATFTVQGTNGNCTIPTSASAVAANATIVNGTAASFLTLWPSDQTKPTASSLNWTAGQAPTPNKVDIKLSTDGKMSAFNNVGIVDLIVDVVGYYRVANPGVDGVEFSRNSTTRAMALGTPFEGTSVVVSAPFDGFVIVNATAQLVNNGALLNCDVEKTATINGAEGFTAKGVAPLMLISGSKGFPVTAGDTTFYLMCLQVDGVDGTVSMDRATLTAHYSITRA
jgi:hypothetical protein